MVGFTGGVRIGDGDAMLEASAPSPRVGLVIPSCNAGEKWPACLDAIKQQTVKPERLLVIDSASTDGTAATAVSAGFEVISILRSEFNHGGTRQWAAEYLSDCNLLVFLTQDAILASPSALENIVRCLASESVALAYGRQIPHEGASALASHARLYNYGVDTLRKDLASAASLGAKVFFCSNSFAAYDRAILLKLGGFRRDLILGEDMEFAARAVQAGYALVYCSKSLARHSHDYTSMQTLKRYFDIGVLYAMNSWLREQFGSNAGEGKRFVLSELRYLWAHDRSKIPSALLQTATKLIGYRLGLMERFLPVFVKKSLSTMPSFWTVRHYR